MAPTTTHAPPLLLLMGPQQQLITPDDLDFVNLQKSPKTAIRSLPGKASFTKNIMKLHQSESENYAHVQKAERWHIGRSLEWNWIGQNVGSQIQSALEIASNRYQKLGACSRARTFAQSSLIGMKLGGAKCWTPLRARS